MSWSVIASWTVTKDDIAQAVIWAESALTYSGKVYTGGIHTIVKDDGEHLLHGALGELFFQRHIAPDAKKIHQGKDLEADFDLYGIRIDVKTKRRSVNVEGPDYTFEVPEYQNRPDRMVDWYAFMNLNVQTWTLEYIGCISKKHFWNASILYREGEQLSYTDLSGRPRIWVCSKDCHLITAAEIKSLNQFSKHLKIKNPEIMSMPENKPKSFVLFQNDYAKSDKAPQWKGKIVLEDGTEEQIVMWEKTSAKGVKFFSGKFEPFQERYSGSNGATSSPQVNPEKSPF